MKLAGLKFVQMASSRVKFPPKKFVSTIIALRLKKFKLIIFLLQTNKPIYWSLLSALPHGRPDSHIDIHVYVVVYDSEALLLGFSQPRIPLFCTVNPTHCILPHFPDAIYPLSLFHHTSLQRTAKTTPHQSPSHHTSLHKTSPHHTAIHHTNQTKPLTLFRYIPLHHTFTHTPYLH